MVFQKPNPFPKSIYDNVAYGPRINGRKRGDMDDIVEHALQRAALWDEVKDKLKKSALALSGGQQQRLCIARALAVEPDVILMDEPCSALDPIATARIEDLMEELKRDYTIVIVTHNMQQAARVSDRTAFFTAEVDDERAASRAARRVRRHRDDLHATRPIPAPRATSPDGSAEPAPARRVGADMRTRKQTVIALERELAREIATRATREVDRERLAHALDAFDGRRRRGRRRPATRSLRNPAAERFRDARHGDALAEEAIERAARAGARPGSRRGARAAALRPAARGAAAPGASRCSTRRRDRRRGRVRPRHHRAAPRRERAARLRRQREPRAEDADRRDGAARRDDRVQRRHRGDPAARRAARAGGRPARPASSTTSSTSA